jgi:hypothetical protein
MMDGLLNDDMMKAYEADGFVIAPGMVDSKEIDPLRGT